MPPDAPPPATPTATPAAPVDGVTASAPAPLSPDESTPQVLMLRKRILVVGLVAYGAFALWCVFLLLVLPDPAGARSSLVSVGLLTSLLGVLALIGAGLFALKRISLAPASIALRRRSLLTTIAILLPGVLLGAATPLLIVREPSLPLEITQPASAADLIAPVAVTLSAERAEAILKNLGFRPLKVQWDTDGDGTMNDETVPPVTTVVYERAGVYTAVARILLEGGGFRRIARRVVIPQAVFSMVPIAPVVGKPVKFSVASLLTDPKLLKQVQWDFGDGNPVQTVTGPDVLYTYYAIGSYPIAATVQLQNQSQVVYKRTVTVQEPPALPFPITLATEPRTLLGPPPFGVLFRLETTTPLKDIAWSFGDGKEDRGPALVRTSHAFEAPGIYPVVVRARSAEGALAELTAIVRVTEILTLGSLQFEGKPTVQGGKISGEVPLEISLTPKTSTPLVEFSWEVPAAASLQSRDGTLTGVLRKEGTVTVTLVGQGAGGKSMRMPITIAVLPPSAAPAIAITPDGGVAPLTVMLDGSQTFVPPGQTVAGFKWLFGDEPQGTRTPELGSARVEHTYQKPGEYTIRLAVVLTSGKEFTAQRTLIVRRSPLSACITASRLTVEAGKGVEFDSSCSTGKPESLLWDVRRDDDPERVQGQSGDPRYVFVFEEPGTYTVTLTLRDAQGAPEKTAVMITVQPTP